MMDIRQRKIVFCHVVGRYREMVAALRDGIPVPTVRALRAQFFFFCVKLAAIAMVLVFLTRCRRCRGVAECTRDLGEASSTMGAKLSVIGESTPFLTSG